MKKQESTLKGNVEVEIGGIKYCGTVNLKPAKNEGKKPNYPVWGVKIDRKNSDPETAIEYIGAAEGFTPARATDPGSWENVPVFNKIRPCLIMGGEVVEYLNPKNYNETDKGNPLGNVRNYGDTMVEFGKIFYRISQDEQYNYVEVTDSAESLKDGFTDWAFSYKGKVRDNFYIGAYKGYVRNGRLRSIPGNTPTGNMTIGQFRTAAQANGYGYEIMAFNKLTLLQVLYLIRFKSLNSQAAVGNGFTRSSEYGEAGKTDSLGMYYGNQDPTNRVKVHGLEDFWGNVLEWVDGFITTDKISIADGNFNDRGDGYETAAELPDTIRGITTDIYGDNKLGFVPKEADDDLEPGKTNYCNWGSTWTDDAGYFPFFGGYRSAGASAGAFYFVCYYSASVAVAVIGARLLFMGDE